MLTTVANVNRDNPEYRMFTKAIIAPYAFHTSFLIGFMATLATYPYETGLIRISNSNCPSSYAASCTTSLSWTSALASDEGTGPRYSRRSRPGHVRQRVARQRQGRTIEASRGNARIKFASVRRSTKSR
jgi:hypothetical protein